MSRKELETYWTLVDVLVAHQTLDALDQAEAEAQPKPPEKTRRRGR